MSERPRKHHFITGNDELKVGERARDLAREWAPEDGMNFEQLDGRAETVEQACELMDRWQEALLTLPFMGGEKLVLVKQATVFQDTVIGRSERVLARLDDLLKVLEETQDGSVLCLIAAPAADKRKRFYKTFQKWGETEVHDVPEMRGAGAVEAWIAEVESQLKAAGTKPAPGVAEALLDLVGPQPRQLRSEVEKLALYAHPDGKIEVDDLREVVSASRELLVWDLCDAVTEGNTSHSTHVVRQLLVQGESEVGILILLGNQVRLAALLVWMQEQGLAKLKQSQRSMGVEIAADGNDLLPVNASGKTPSPYRMARILSRAKKRSAARWFEGLDLIFESHLQLLSGKSDRSRLLETAVVRLCEL